MDWSIRVLKSISYTRVPVHGLRQSMYSGLYWPPVDLFRMLVESLLGRCYQGAMNVIEAASDQCSDGCGVEWRILSDFSDWRV